VVEADIERILNRTPHAPLLNQLHTLVADDDLLGLVGQIFCAPVMDANRASSKPLQTRQ
jgi:retron-type reverse transcriptase